MPASGDTGVSVACTTRRWNLGQPIAHDNVNVRHVRGGIDQNGKVTVIFVKQAAGFGGGGTYQLYSTRGTPGAPGSPAQWTPAVRVDTPASSIDAVGNFAGQELSLAVSSNGTAHAIWVSTAPCTATSWDTGVCRYINSATLAPGAAAWSAPIVVGDSVGAPVIPQITALVNDRGDVAVQYAGYVLGAPVVHSSSGTVRGAVATRAAAQSSFQVRPFADITRYDSLRVTLDQSGGMVAAADRTQTGSSNVDVVAYVGNVTTGFPATSGTPVDQLGNTASIGSMVVGAGGEVLLTWLQNDGGGSKLMAASKAAGGGAWSTPAPIATAFNANVAETVITDAGSHLAYIGCNAYVLDKPSNSWNPKVPPLPGQCATSDRSIARDGSYLTMSTAGLWLTYNQSDNGLSRSTTAVTGADYLLGFAKLWGNAAQLVFARNLAGNYVGAVLVIDEFDTLPTPTATSGVGRNGIANLWGFFLN